MHPCSSWPPLATHCDPLIPQDSYQTLDPYLIDSCWDFLEQGHSTRLLARRQIWPVTMNWIATGRPANGTLIWAGMQTVDHQQPRICIGHIILYYELQARAKESRVCVNISHVTVFWQRRTEETQPETGMFQFISHVVVRTWTKQKLKANRKLPVADILATICWSTCTRLPSCRYRQF